MWSKIQLRQFKEGMDRDEQSSEVFKKARPLAEKYLYEWRQIDDDDFNTIEKVKELGQKVLECNEEVKGFLKAESSSTSDLEVLRRWFTKNPEELRKIWRRCFVKYLSEYKAKCICIKEEVHIALAKQDGNLNRQSKTYYSLLKKVVSLSEEYDKLNDLMQVDNEELATPPQGDEVKREWKGFRERSLDPTYEALKELQDSFYKLSEHRSLLFSSKLLLVTAISTGLTLVLTGASLVINYLEYRYGIETHIQTLEPIQVESIQVPSKN